MAYHVWEHDAQERQQNHFLHCSRHLLRNRFRFFLKLRWESLPLVSEFELEKSFLIKLISCLVCRVAFLCCSGHSLSFFLSWWKLEFSFSRGVDLSSDCRAELPLYSLALAARHWGLNGEPALDKHGHTWHSFLASWPPLQTSHIPAVWRQGSAARAKQHCLSQSSFHLEWEVKSG